jgi:selenide,water dikinase
MMEAGPHSSRTRELVLIGGGHAHVQVVRRWAMAPLPGVRLSVVLDRAEAVYSGMVPGFVAGDYDAAECEIDVVPLARRAGARVILAPASEIDPHARRVGFAERPPLAYDVASLDVGSSVRGQELPGVAEHALATRPIRDFVDRLDAALARASTAARARAGGPTLRVVVVGGGAAGVELTLCVEARLRARGAQPELTLATDAPEILPGAWPALRRRALAELAARRIALRTGSAVLRVQKDALELAGGARLACDLAIWAAGAAPVALVAKSALPKDEAGFVRVQGTLQVEGHDALFAAGDCASLTEARWVPKAGVYAVRQGPLLADNLRLALSGEPLRRYRPQRDFLTLLNLGEERALGAKWGLVASGRLAFRLKDAIDRRFVRRFQVLGADGAPSAEFPPLPEDAAMRCGGCAAKVSARALADALASLPPAAPDPRVLLGLDARDDAAALRSARGDVWIATADGFRAFSDDAWLVGRVAALNALSDVYAKGGAPRHALCWVTAPEGDDAALRAALAGVRAALDPLGVSLVGGHSMLGSELTIGLAVLGDLAPGEAPLTKAGLAPGDVLVLTKPLGTGVVLAADLRALARGAWVRAAHAAMLRPNERAGAVARRFARAATDVSGFGLAGHLGEMLAASGVAAELDAQALPALPGARALLARGVRSTSAPQNADSAPPFAGGDPVAHALACDPQTSGGLLLAVAPEHAPAALAALHGGGDTQAAAIGRVTDRGRGITWR